MSDDKKTFMAAFMNSLSDEAKAAYLKFKSDVKAFATKFNTAPTPAPTPTPAPVALESEVKIAGTETVLVIAGDPATATAEAPVMVVDKSTGAPAPDGEHKLEDGSTITVTAGGITAYKPAEVIPPIDQAAAVAQAATALKAEFASQKVDLAKQIETKFAAQIAEQNQTIQDLNKQVQYLADFHIHQMETAVEVPVKKKTEIVVDPNNLTGFQKFQMEKYGEIKY